MVLAKGLRSQSGYCWAGTDKVAWRAVSTLDGRVLTAFVVSFASAMRQLECKSGVSPQFQILVDWLIADIPRVFGDGTSRLQVVGLAVWHPRFALPLD